MCRKVIRNRHVTWKTGALHFLHCIHRRDAQYHRSAHLGLADNAFCLFARDQRAHRIVHQHKVGVRWDFRERVAHRFLPRVSAAHDAYRPVKLFFRQPGRQRLYIVSASGDQELIDRRALRQPSQRENNHGDSAQQSELLGQIRAHARSKSCGRQDGDYPGHSISRALQCRIGGAKGQKFITKRLSRGPMEPP